MPSKRHIPHYMPWGGERDIPDPDVAEAESSSLTRSGTGFSVAICSDTIGGSTSVAVKNTLRGSGEHNADCEQ